jgi:type VI secretion system protein ImpE
MTVQELIQAGDLDAAIAQLVARLRDHPEDGRSRTSLFELLCFTGDFDRAEKHLSLLGDSNQDTRMGALLYHGALHAERLRKTMFVEESWPQPLPKEQAAARGAINGKPFASLSDADPRIGARLEVFAAGDYMWIPFSQIALIEIEAPKRMRDLLWASARVRTAPNYAQRELGEVLLPALAPLTWQHSDPAVLLGRVTEWCADESGREAPYGQKLLMVDGEEMPILEIRQLEIESGQSG